VESGVDGGKRKVERMDSEKWNVKSRKSCTVRACLSARPPGKSPGIRFGLCSFGVKTNPDKECCSDGLETVVSSGFMVSSWECADGMGAVRRRADDSTQPQPLAPSLSSSPSVPQKSKNPPPESSEPPHLPPHLLTAWINMQDGRCDDFVGPSF
jgi:hypothetical protein